MTKRETANLACRILAVYYFVQGLAGLPAMIGELWSLLQAGADLGTAAIYSAAQLWSLIVIAAAAFLWRWSGLVAAWMTGYDIQDHRDEPDSQPRRADLKDIHVVVLSSLGAWVLVAAIPQMIWYLTELIFHIVDAGQPGELSAGRYIELTLRTVLGFWLLFGGRGIVELLWRLRRLGLTRDEEPSPERRR